MKMTCRLPAAAWSFLSMVLIAAAAFSAQAGNINSSSNKDLNAAAARMLSAQRSCERGCHDCWYEYFPGMVNYCLGMHYWENGSYRSGLKLLKLAAGWGNKDAQYTLGLIYFNGHHVATDRARGLAWLMLANERQDDDQTNLAVRSAMHLASARENHRAVQLLEQMRDKYADAVAGRRAWRHLRNRLKPQPWSLGGRIRSYCIQIDGSTAPWTPGAMADPDQLCMASGPFAKAVAKVAKSYFEDMFGTVTVRPLQQVPAPASSQ